jgi:hypothetical protein
MHAVLPDPFAEKAYRNLQARGLKSLELFWELVGILVVVSRKRVPLSSLLEAGRALERLSGPFKTAQALADWSREVRAFAGRIERVNAHPLYCISDAWRLPAILREYAKQLQGRHKLLHRKTKLAGKTLILDALRWLVRKETGQESPADLAKILEAATRESTEHPGYEYEAALKMRAQRAPLK